jgi:diguanylate cyclase (GGDEF)-like protein
MVEEILFTLCQLRKSCRYFNARYGHNVGDEKLKEIAKLICQNLPDGIDVFRTGGDEFLILIIYLKWQKLSY